MAATVDMPFDPEAHATGLVYDPRPWGLGIRAKCSCGWRGLWQDAYSAAEHDATVHQAHPGERGAW